jgi:uncharacterized membrane protein (DUF4010 family)
MESILNPAHFLLTIVLSFLTGLEIKTYRQEYHGDSTMYFFGTARTATFLGILGFLLYVVEPAHCTVYIAGFLAFSALFSIFYWHRLQARKTSSVLLYLVSGIVYSYGPVSVLFPVWLPALLFVLTVFLLNARAELKAFAIKLEAKEIETFSKMVLLSAVILPLLPNDNIIPYIPLSPFKIWLAVVVVSTISYGGYITQQYLFPSKGIFLTALIGGTYSSTATTVVLARKAREARANRLITGSIIAATSVMYLRLVTIAFVFNSAIALKILCPFVLFSFIGFAASFFYYRSGRRRETSINISSDNPLELGTAFVFALLFVVMILLTEAVIRFYGVKGLEMFSFVAGLSDIDPFILSLLTGKYVLKPDELLSAIMIAAGSNNVTKAVYALWFGSWRNTGHAFLWLLILGVMTIVTGLVVGHCCIDSLSSLWLK